MNSVRAYNMNLKDLIYPELNHDHVRDHGVVINDHPKPPKANNDVTASGDMANDSSVQVDISPIWKQVAGSIDLKNATASEVADLSSALFKAGAITFEDHINLSFQKDESSDEKTDYIAHWQAEQQKATHRGAVHEELNDIVRIQSILGYVDSLKG